MSFSVPRCNSPMCGSTRSTISPSSSSTRRSTPCAAGCCGPKLMVKLRTFSAISDLPFRLPVGRCEGHENLRACHVLGLVGEVVVGRLLVDEDLACQHITGTVVEGLGRRVAMSVLH